MSCVEHACDARAEPRRTAASGSLQPGRSRGLAAFGITEGFAYDWANGVLLGLDGEDHARIRRLTTPGLNPRYPDTMRPHARELIREVADGVDDRGRDDLAQFGASYSVRMMCHLLGFPDEDWRRLAAWSDAAVQLPTTAVVDQLDRISTALHELRAYHFDMLFPAPGLPMGIDGPDAMRAFQEQFAEIVETEGIHDSFRTFARLEHARVRRRRALAYLHKDLTAARGAPTCRAGLVCAATRSIARPRGRVTRWSSSRSRGRPRSGRRRDAARAAGQ